MSNARRAPGRPGLVGTGYLPKGGRAAGAAHNQAVRAAVAPTDAPPVITEPAPPVERPDGRTCARASGCADGRTAARRLGRLAESVVAPVAASAVTVALIEWALR